MNEVVCKDGIYDKYEGATDWRQTHSSQTDRDQVRVYTRKRHTGEKMFYNYRFPIMAKKVEPYLSYILYKLILFTYQFLLNITTYLYAQNFSKN